MVQYTAKEVLDMQPTKQSLLERLRQESPELEELLAFYEQLDRVYHAGLRAMGVESQPKYRRANLTEMKFTVKPRVISTVSRG